MNETETEYTYTYNATTHESYIRTTLNKSRSARGETRNEGLRNWARNIVESKNIDDYSIWGGPRNYSQTSETAPVEVTIGDIEASRVENVVGGPWITLLSLMDRTKSQYMIKNTTTLPQAASLGPGSLIQPILDYRYNVYPSVWVYHFLYRYSISVTVILAMTVITLYMFVACCGSLWQLCKGGKVILAWASVPEYLLLGESTAAELRGLGYTEGGGEEKKKRFHCGVRVDRLEDGSRYGIKLGDVDGGAAQVSEQHTLK